MSPLLGAILLYVAALIGFLLGTAAFVRFAVNRLIGQKHRLLEEILDTGKLPQAWTDGAARPADAEKRVRRLAAYVRKTRLVDGEETRALLLARLEQAGTSGKE
ncbi:hypothetical protein SAMN02799624_01946 [Paenibacillus sp. UNC496MF]|uniref:hypothetical protein n=1 Tax=Paenibacillus sp. UNC496MF TaxID=1502753 RepID=UPI0008E43125|nr:hypothetical protein [Paenibacillus sp. UNC496MF]SFI73690.1 hypothetical protein SAMN02799624_01946 [Paenibacillus sp. UNC496MF]